MDSPLELVHGSQSWQHPEFRLTATTVELQESHTGVSSPNITYTCIFINQGNKIITRQRILSRNESRREQKPCSKVLFRQRLTVQHFSGLWETHFSSMSRSEQWNPDNPAVSRSGSGLQTQWWQRNSLWGLNDAYRVQTAPASGLFQLGQGECSEWFLLDKQFLPPTHSCQEWGSLRF